MDAKNGYSDYWQAEIDIATYNKYYNHQRGHSYNTYQTPVAVEAA